LGINQGSVPVDGTATHPVLPEETTVGVDVSEIRSKTIKMKSRPFHLALCLAPMRSNYSATELPVDRVALSALPLDKQSHATVVFRSAEKRRFREPSQ
jgi:hypothetical protein